MHQYDWLHMLVKQAIYPMSHIPGSLLLLHIHRAASLPWFGSLVSCGVLALIFYAIVVSGKGVQVFPLALPSVGVHLFLCSMAVSWRMLLDEFHLHLCSSCYCSSAFDRFVEALSYCFPKHASSGYSSPTPPPTPDFPSCSSVTFHTPLSASIHAAERPTPFQSSHLPMICLLHCGLHFQHFP